MFINIIIKSPGEYFGKEMLLPTMQRHRIPSNFHSLSTCTLAIQVSPHFDDVTANLNLDWLRLQLAPSVAILQNIQELILLRWSFSSNPSLKGLGYKGLHCLYMLSLMSLLGTKSPRLIP